MSIARKLKKLLWDIAIRDRIPKLPKRMLANQFEVNDANEEQWRVLSRLGARDPAGVKVAMKRAGVDNVYDLIAMLEHQEAQRQTRERWESALNRFVGGKPYDPHEAEIKRVGKKLNWREQQHDYIRERMKYIEARLKE